MPQRIFIASQGKNGLRGDLHWRFVAVQCNKKFCDRKGKKKEKIVQVVETHNVGR